MRLFFNLFNSFFTFSKSFFSPFPLLFFNSFFISSQFYIVSVSFIFIGFNPLLSNSNRSIIKIYNLTFLSIFSQFFNSFMPFFSIIIHVTQVNFFMEFIFVSIFQFLVNIFILPVNLLFINIFNHFVKEISFQFTILITFIQSFFKSLHYFYNTFTSK